MPRNQAPPEEALDGAGIAFGTAAMHLLCVGIAGFCLHPLSAGSADVVGYSVLKGQFLNQAGATELVLDPDFGFSLLASVDLTDFDLLTAARFRLPEGATFEMDNLGDSWSVLDSFGSKEELDEAYVWGDYFVIFDAVNDGNHSCLVELPESPLPPTPRLVNFADVQMVDPGRPLTLVWEFDDPPESDDFVQVYVNLGHGEVFSTPNLGEPGALLSTDRTTTIPAGVLSAGFIHSLNIEITRILSTNTECYPQAQGAGALFRSTSVDVFVWTPPALRLLSGPAKGEFTVEVVGDPDQPVVLQGSLDLSDWTNVATNSAPSGTNVFSVPAGAEPRRFFRAQQR